MCGPLLLALPAGHGGVGTLALRRLIYHSGRILMYGVVGVLFGWIGHAIGLAHVQRWVSLAAGVLVLGSLLLWPARISQGFVARPIGWLKVGFSRMISRHTPGAQFALGAINGLLPCGLVYVAAAASAASGGPARGGLFMLVFGLGTLPMLLGMAFAGRVMHRWLQPRLRLFVPLCMALMACLLILRGLSLGIPYLSPDLSAETPHCCAPPVAASSTP
jgi:sulfite exporter TauE/SafE